MKHLYKVPGTNKIVQKKYVRIGEGSVTYSIGHHRFIEMARAAGAVYKLGDAQGGTVLINLELFDEYMEQFHEPAVIYGLGKTRIMTLAAEAGAIYKVGNSALVNTELFEAYLEKFREPAREIAPVVAEQKHEYKVDVRPISKGRSR